VNGGAIIVDVPRWARALAGWRVRVGGAVGRPGECVPAPAGEQLVVIEAHRRAPGASLAARLRATVPIVPGRTTRLRVPLPKL